eukprot:snap_masked-scaffold_14-processed-gene-2.43-mRNA-1 protein AED:1.00 eAED:1.00 QI:0/-1/0/0/-1/1/1/0/897
MNNKEEKQGDPGMHFKVSRIQRKLPRSDNRKENNASLGSPKKRSQSPGSSSLFPYSKGKTGSTQSKLFPRFNAPFMKVGRWQSITKSTPAPVSTEEDDPLTPAFNTLNYEHAKIENTSKLMILGTETSRIKAVVHHLFGDCSKKRNQQSTLLIHSFSYISSNEPRVNSSFSKAQTRGTRILHLRAGERKVKKTSEEIFGLNVFEFTNSDTSYVLHQTCLTENTLYLLVFDARKLYYEFRNKETTELGEMKKWLREKQLNASTAPLILVGTFEDSLSPGEIEFINKRLQIEKLKQVFGYSKAPSKLYGNSEGHFLPLNTRMGEGKLDLKNYLQTQQAKQLLTIQGDSKFTRSAATYQLLMDSEALCKTNDDISVIAKAIKEDIRDLNMSLKLLAEKGFILYFTGSNPSVGLIILDFEWFINALSIVTVSSDSEYEFGCSPQLEDELFTVLETRKLTRAFLESYWKEFNINSRIRRQLCGVLERKYLIHKLESKDQFLAPILSTPVFPHLNLETENFTGPYFELLPHAVNTNQDNNTHQFFPFGFFEKLVVALAKCSSSRSNSRELEIAQGEAKLSLGTQIDFSLSVSREKVTGDSSILVRTKRGTKYLQAMQLISNVEDVITMVKIENFGSTSFFCNVFIPSSEKTGEKLVSLEILKENQRDGKSGAFRLMKGAQQRRTSMYEHWFNVSNNDSKNSSMVSSEQSYTTSSTLTSYGKICRFRDLPGDMTRHCFLSYKQKDSIDLVYILHLLLESKGFKCWSDQRNNNKRGLSSKTMIQGVKNSWCYILFFSENYHSSNSVQLELETAIKYKKPIFIVGHPDIGQNGYPSLGTLMDNAPPMLVPFLDEEILIFQRRNPYHQIFINSLVARLEMKLKKDLLANELGMSSSSHMLSEYFVSD